MNRYAFAMLIAAVLVLAAFTGPANAQGGNCFGDVVYFRACFLEGHRLQVLRIENGRGIEVGIIPGEVYPYAAAYYDSAQLIYTISADGYAAELYFTGKMPAPANGYDTTWTLVFYGPAGPLSRAEFTRRTAADPGISLPAPMPVGGRRTAGAAASPAPVDVPVVGAFEPSIIRPGSVSNCLVRSMYTVRMRQAPSTGAAVLDRVPYGTSMPADMQTSDGQWVRAFFVGEGGVGRLGWVFASYLDLSDACANITVVAPLAAALPVAPAVSTPAAPAEPLAVATPFDPTWGGQLDLTIVQPGSVQTCLVRTTYTVRMRAMPTESAPVLVSVPYQSSMPADLRTSDGGWVRANYLGSLGWISSQYLSLSEACAGLPAINPLR